jgi:hypothetical protein
MHMIIPPQALSQLSAAIAEVRGRAYGAAIALGSDFVPAGPVQDDLVRLGQFAQRVLGGVLPPLFVQAVHRSHECEFVAYTTINQGLQALEAEMPHGRHAARAA